MFWVLKKDKKDQKIKAFPVVSGENAYVPRLLGPSGFSFFFRDFLWSFTDTERGTERFLWSQNNASKSIKLLKLAVISI